jgi:DNA-binding transcriptional LysR family regulator
MIDNVNFDDMKDLNLSHLRYFYDSAKLGGMVAAASKNFVTHSTVSQGIKKLEQNLEIELLQHKKREFKLTDAGKSLLSECEKVFLTLKSFENQIHLAKENPTGQVSFASSHSVLSAFLLEPLAKMKGKFPAVSFSFRLGKTPYVRDWVLDGTADFGLTIDDGLLDKVDKTKVFSGNFVLVKNPEYNEELPQFLITEPRPETVEFKKQFQKIYKREAPILMEVDSWELITKMVEHGLGIGLVPDFQLQKLMGRNIKKVRLNINIPYDLVIVQRRGTKLSRNSELLLQFIR